MTKYVSNIAVLQEDIIFSEFIFLGYERPLNFLLCPFNKQYSTFVNIKPLLIVNNNYSLQLRSVIIYVISMCTSLDYEETPYYPFVIQPCIRIKMGMSDGDSGEGM